MQVENIAAIVTGGASGMGKATAKLLAQQGAKVSLFDMNLAAAEKTAAEIKAHAVHCDVANADSVVKAVKEAEVKHGPARIIINCAGIVHSRRMVNKEGPMPLEEYRRVLEVNLLGTFNVMRITAEAMMKIDLPKEEERGVMINTASVAAFEGQIGQTAYSSSKGGIVALTLPAARELAAFAIRVNTIAPGLVDTPMFAQLTDEARQSLAASVPYPKRLARPEEYAQLALQIIANTMINGTVIRLDGALRMQAK
jgi:NAD(P)-dependent dehydrogenase (short-subunit alcohol dehydrogenase family)